MRILLVHNSYQEPGGEDVVFQQESELLKSGGHEVLEYRRSNDEIKQLSGMRRLGLFGHTVWSYDTWREVRELLRSKRPDVVHIHNTFLMISPSIYRACHDENIAVVQTLHNYRLLCPAASFLRDGRPCEDCVTRGLWRGVQHGCYRNSRVATMGVAVMLAVHRQFKTWLQMVDRYIALTEFAKAKFVGAGFPQDKIIVKPNFAYPDPGPRLWHCPGSYALFVGRVSAEKGICTLLNSWQRAAVDSRLVIVGDGPLSTQLQADVGRLATSRISFTGRLPRQQVIDAMKEARFLVFPSQLYENFPLTIVEAFACGLPVIASDIGAMREIVKDGMTGLLFRAGDTEELTKKLIWASAHPELMQRIGKQARFEYESKYTASANRHMLMAIYEQAIKMKRSQFSANPRFGHSILPQTLFTPSTRKTAP